MTQRRPNRFATVGPRFANALLFGVTAVGLGYLLAITAEFTVADWIYVAQHSIVLAVSFIRRPALAKDYSLRASVSVFVAYAYPYAQSRSFARRPVTPPGLT